MVEAELREGCSIVATDISAVFCFDLLDLALALSLDTRVGTSERSEELIYTLMMVLCCSLEQCRPVTWEVFQVPGQV